jgi:DNA-binding NarL/FixJ family response regulator
VVSKTYPARRPTVCLLSSHPLVLEEFQHLLSHLEFRLKVQCFKPSRAAGPERLSLPRAHMYVTDAHAPRQVIEMLVAKIQDSYPMVRQLVVAERFTETNAFPLLRLGAKGLLTYPEARQKLPKAVEVVAGGGFWVPRHLLSQFVDWILARQRRRLAVKGPTDITVREREVLHALLENLSNKEIASKLRISERTVKFHVSSLLAKFGVRRRWDLILLCFQDSSPGL